MASRTITTITNITIAGVLGSVVDTSLPQKCPYAPIKTVDWTSQIASMQTQDANTCAETAQGMLWELWSSETTQPGREACAHFYACWVNATHLLNRAKGSEWEAALTGIARASSNLCHIALLGIFGTAVEVERQWVIATLKTSSASATNVCDFIAAATTAAKSAGVLSEIFMPLVVEIVDESVHLQLPDACLPMVQMVQVLIREDEVANAVVAHPRWLPDGTGGHLGRHSLLGPFLSASTTPRARYPPNPNEIGLHVFPGHNIFAHVRDSELESTRNMVRQSISFYRTQIFAIFRRLLSDASRREAVMKYIAAAINRNASRARSMFDPVNSCSDGFALNLLAILLQLCEPFVKSGNFDKLDNSYLLRATSLFDLSSDSPVACSIDDISKARESLEGPATTTNTFISFAFFATLWCLRISTIAVSDSLNNDWLSSNRRAAVEDGLRRARDAHRFDIVPVIEHLRDCIRIAPHSFFSEFASPLMFSQLLQFYGYFSRWVFRVLGVTGELPQTIAIQYGSIPDFFIENLGHCIVDATSFATQELEASPDTQSIESLLVLLIGCKLTITNPYIRARLVQAVSAIINHSSKALPRASAFFFTDRMALQLGPHLMQFYVDAENTDFFGKLSIRHNIQTIVEELWKMTGPRRTIVEYSHDPLFVRFAMLVINDVVYLFDEGRDTVKKIRDLRRAADPQQANELNRSQSNARAVFQLARGSLSMLAYLTTEIVTPFTRPEVVGRLASMITCNITALMKTQDDDATVAQEFGLDLKEMLLQLAHIAVNVSQIASIQSPVSPVNGQDVFVDALAHEERFYNHDVMASASPVLRGIGDLSRQYLRLLDLVEVQRRAVKEADIPLDEIPDNFLDPILCNLMKDPVELPMSHTIIDRSTISEHLLSQPTDPFNRSPLTLADLIERPDIKKEIEDWLKSRSEKEKPQ